MKWASYTWCVVVNLFSLFIAAQAMSRFDSDFERAVMASLVLIYASVQAFFIAYVGNNLERFRVERTRFMELLRATGSAKYDDEESRENWAEGDKVVAKESVKLWINSAANFLMLMMGLLGLGGAL